MHSLVLSYSRSLPHTFSVMKDPVEGFKYVMSLERLVGMTRGLKTPSLYDYLKRMAIHKDSDWRPAVQRMTDSMRRSRVAWCEVFLSDMLLLDGYITRFEARMLTLGLDTAASPLSDQHHTDKLMTLLTRGEEAMQNEDMAEAVMHRGVYRLRKLIRWAYGVRLPSTLSFVSLRIEVLDISPVVCSRARGCATSCAASFK